MRPTRRSAESLLKHRDRGQNIEGRGTAAAQSRPRPTEPVRLSTPTVDDSDRRQAGIGYAAEAVIYQWGVTYF